MLAVDPGHEYLLDCFDGYEKQRLRFMKREGPGYPGNFGHYAGTNMQEVLRALISRVEYLQNQIACAANVQILAHLRDCIRLLEQRAAERHNRSAELFDYRNRSNNWIETLPTCAKCGHIGCSGECHDAH